MMNREDARGQQEAWVALWKVECQAKVNKCLQNLIKSWL